jgi:MOSC domain-containing protein YiiM
MHDDAFPRRFAQALRPGTYLRIVAEGQLGAEDEIRVIHRPDHDLTIRDVFRIYIRDRNEVKRLVAIPQMSGSWRRWAETLLEKGKGRRADEAAPERVGAQK